MSTNDERPTVSEEAVEAAAIAYSNVNYAVGWGCIGPRERDVIRANIRAALTAALPHLAAQSVTPRPEQEREWQNTRWWRAVGPKGDLWCESSNEREVRERARPTDTIQHLMQEVPRTQWVDDRAPALDGGTGGSGETDE